MLGLFQLYNYFIAYRSTAVRITRAGCQDIRPPPPCPTPSMNSDILHSFSNESQLKLEIK